MIHSFQVQYCLSIKGKGFREGQLIGMVCMPVLPHEQVELSIGCVSVYVQPLVAHTPQLSITPCTLTIAPVAFSPELLLGLGAAFYWDRSL